MLKTGDCEAALQAIKANPAVSSRRRVSDEFGFSLSRVVRQLHDFGKSIQSWRTVPLLNMELLFGFIKQIQLHIFDSSENCDFIYLKKYW